MERTLPQRHYVRHEVVGSTRATLVCDRLNSLGNEKLKISSNERLIPTYGPPPLKSVPSQKVIMNGAESYE